MDLLNRFFALVTAALVVAIVVATAASFLGAHVRPSTPVVAQDGCAPGTVAAYQLPAMKPTC